MKLLALSLLVILSFSGCIYKNANHHFTSVSPKIEHDAQVSDKLIKEVSKSYRLTKQNCTASQGDWWVYSAIPVYVQSTADESLVKVLLEKCKGDLATNVKIENRYFYTHILNYFGKRATADIWVKR